MVGLNIDLIVVGKLKEKYLRQGIEEYVKRLSRYCKLNIIEIADESTSETMTEIEVNQVLTKEGERIQAYLKPDRKIWVLAIEGKLLSSEDIAQEIEDYATYGKSKLSIIIGGSLGLAPFIKAQADLSISFGRITLPHQLMRLVCLEQIYRAFRIINHQPYHK